MSTANGPFIKLHEDLGFDEADLQDKFNQVNGVIATKLASSVYDARIVNEAVFFDSVKNSIVFNDAAGVELDYAALGLVPA